MHRSQTLNDSIFEHCNQSMDNALSAERYPLWERSCPELKDTDFIYRGLLRCISQFDPFSAENMAAYEYSVFATSMDSVVITIFQHHRDRADCENNFDGIKNQWGWGGFVTQKIKHCRLIVIMIVFVYNWWTLFVRLAEPDKYLGAITSRSCAIT